MAEQDATAEVDLYQVARIVSSYVRHHHIAPHQLVELIGATHRALASLGAPGAAPEGRPRQPAVPIRRSVQRYYVVCLECGFRAIMLRRHLRLQHGLDVAAYRARWNLPATHPVTAPAYSEQRSAMAKAIGLGRRRRSGEALGAQTGRGRPRRPTTPR
jgi:predicted transcriptional regulator